MSTTPRKWPHNCAWARDDSAELAQATSKELDELLDHWREYDETTKILVLSKSLNNLQLILRKLEAVGAQTRP